MTGFRLLLVAAAAALAALAFPARQAEAYGAPWCAVYPIGWGDTEWDCSYWTLKACVPYVIAGNRGFCNENPHYTGPALKRPRTRRKHHVRHP